MAFNNAVVGGTVLLREAIQSPNYQAGLAGWTINQDGTAEFADLEIRSTDGSGNRIELANGSVQLYDSLGDLVAELSASLPGLIVGKDTEPQVMIYSAFGGIGRVEFPANSPNANIRAALTLGVFSAGTPDEVLSFQMQGPSVDGATDRLEMLIDSQTQDGAFDAQWILRLAGGTDALLVCDKTQGFASFGRITTAPPPAATAALYVAADTAHTGALMLAQKNSVDRFRVTEAGTGTFAGSVVAANIASGTAQTPAPGGAPAQTSVAVNFAAAFPAVPVVTLTPNSAAANLNTTNIRFAVTGKTVNGFTINCWRDTNAATNFEWHAHI
ncbi:hypothetical protein [Streptomyces sp. NBC_00470]|uniref:hypothetical protein n=1 Tax=Streptomyces sp. NBC_00470 TaxID=2975753 RepID=UPI0030E2314F